MVQLDQVHEDIRGTMYRLLLPGNRELMVLFCKAGYYRGGHSHDQDEMVMLLSGKMRYHKWINDVEQVTELWEGNVTYNTAGCPHLAYFLEDSWVLDWKLDIGPHAAPGVTTDFEPFRQRVRERMTT